MSCEWIKRGTISRNRRIHLSNTRSSNSNKQLFKKMILEDAKAINRCEKYKEKGKQSNTN